MASILRRPLTLLCIAGFISSSVHAQNAIATVSTGTQPNAVAVNPVTNKIYVANKGIGLSGIGCSLTVIDGATNTPTTIASGILPLALAVNPVTNKIYVANNGDTTVTIIDG